MTDDEVYTELRPLLFSIAYRMVATVGDAEDIVQEAFLRYHRAQADGTRVESPRAFLASVTTRVAIDHLRSARVRRENYVGPWLPEPLPTDAVAAIPVEDPAEHAAQSDSLSMAFLLVLERLSPVERAVFLLHDVFGYDFDEVAGMVDRSSANCRQIAVRARRHVAEQRPRFEASRQRREEFADRFVAAMAEGDLDGLISLLTADVVVTGDGGGAPPSWPRAVVGPDKVARLLVALGSDMAMLGVRPQRRELNGQPGALFLDADGRIVSAMVLDVTEGGVQTVRSVISRDKLRHLGPLADLSSLIAARNRARRPGE